VRYCCMVYVVGAMVFVKSEMILTIYCMNGLFGRV
jgi:hypothetical protein